VGVATWTFEELRYMKVEAGRIWCPLQALLPEASSNQGAQGSGTGSRNQKAWKINQQHFLGSHAGEKFNAPVLCAHIMMSYAD